MNQYWKELWSERGTKDIKPWFRYFIIQYNKLMGKWNDPVEGYRDQPEWEPLFPTKYELVKPWADLQRRNDLTYVEGGVFDGETKDLAEQLENHLNSESRAVDLDFDDAFELEDVSVQVSTATTSGTQQLKRPSRSVVELLTVRKKKKGRKMDPVKQRVKEDLEACQNIAKAKIDKEGIAYPDESLPGSRNLCQVCKKDKTKKNCVVFKGRKHQELTPRSAGVTIKFCPFIDDPNLYDDYVAEQKEKKE